MEQSIFYFGGGAPSVVARFIIFLTYSIEMRKDYFGRCFRFGKNGLKWVLFTVLFFTGIAVVEVVLSVYVFGYDMQEFSW